MKSPVPLPPSFFKLDYISLFQLCLSQNDFLLFQNPLLFPAGHRSDICQLAGEEGEKDVEGKPVRVLYHNYSELHTVRMYYLPTHPSQGAHWNDSPAGLCMCSLACFLALAGVWAAGASIHSYLVHVFLFPDEKIAIQLEKIQSRVLDVSGTRLPDAEGST